MVTLERSLAASFDPPPECEGGGEQAEERDLVRIHGVSYQNYRKNVPMIVPFRLRSSARTARSLNSREPAAMNATAGEHSAAD